jgi:glutamate-1-semialdehyde 2,1-aminomutase
MRGSGGMQRTKQPTREWIERSKVVLAQGFPGTNSKRWTMYPAVAPSHTHGHGLGPYLYDAWGNRYLDFPSGLGSLTLGYSNARVTEAVQRQVLKGCSFTLPTTLEVEVAEHLSALIPSAKRLRFLKTGGEASSAAVRIARAATGRRLVLSQGYHGHGDFWTSMTEPALGVKDAFAVLPLQYHQHPDQLMTSELGTFAQFRPEDVAAIIVEALHLEMTDKHQVWLRMLREYCTKHGIVLIFDEIITGFRVPEWTVSRMWGIEPDLILLGKGIANGYPLSVVAGKGELMDSCEYFISSTFSGEAVSLAACKATIREIESTKNLKDLMYYGLRLQEKLNALDPEIKFEGYGTRAMLNTTNVKTALFMQEMCKAGILFGKAHFFHFGHLDANIESFVMNVADGVMTQINSGRAKLEGESPKETFKR